MGHHHPQGQEGLVSISPENSLVTGFAFLPPSPWLPPCLGRWEDILQHVGQNLWGKRHYCSSHQYILLVIFGCVELDGVGSDLY